MDTKRWWGGEVEGAVSINYTVLEYLFQVRYSILLLVKHFCISIVTLYIDYNNKKYLTTSFSEKVF